MKTITIGISGINAVDNPGPGIGVARSLKESADLDVRIVGLAYDAMEPGIYMDWVVDKSYILPYPSGNGRDYIARLLQIKESYGLDLVIPCLDVELPVFIKYAQELADNDIRTFLPSMAQFHLRGKDKLSEIAANINIDLPRTEVVTSYDTLLQAVERIGLPVMVKGSYYKAYRAYTTQEAAAHYHHLVAEWGYPVIVQEIVTGDELNVVGVGDGDGESLGLVGIKKVSITSLGKIWTGVTVRNDRMLSAAAAFVRAYKWRGPFELECIVSGDNVYLIEVNPRFPAWAYFATGVGVNLPAQLVRSCMGAQAEPAADYEAGKLFVRYSYDMVTDMAPFQSIVTRGESA